VAYNQEAAIIGNDYRYDELVDLIESIGYEHRTGNYYIIREKDGYINISYEYDKNHIGHRIRFHKNYYFDLKNTYSDITEDFYNLKDFIDFISKYHNDLFLKHKIEKIINNVSEW